MFSKFKTSLALAKQSWKVLQLDRELLVFPIMSTLALIILEISIVFPILLPNLPDTASGETIFSSKPTFYLGLLLFYFCTYFVVIFFNSALIACALIRFRGGDPTVMGGLIIAVNRLPKILAWSLVSAFVGTLLQAIERRVGIIGKIIIGILGITWAAASFFVVPVIILENVGPIDALKRSGSMIRKFWGEALAVEVGIFLALGLILFPAFVLTIIIVVLAEASPVIVTTAIVAFIILFLAIALIGATLAAILTAALYVYATDGSVPDGFDDDLPDTFFVVK